MQARSVEAISILGTTRDGPATRRMLSCRRQRERRLRVEIPGLKEEHVQAAEAQAAQPGAAEGALAKELPAVQSPAGGPRAAESPVGASPEAQWRALETQAVESPASEALRRSLAQAAAGLWTTP